MNRAKIRLSYMIRKHLLYTWTIFLRLFVHNTFVTYGTCFTFNHETNEDNDPSAGTRSLGETGSGYGLQLVLDLEIDGYMGAGLTQSAGARVAIHEHNVEVRPVFLLVESIFCDSILLRFCQMSTELT